MSQNSMRYNWTREEVDAKLKQIMTDIHNNCIEYGKGPDYNNYVQGANIAGFVKVADAMIAQRCILSLNKTAINGKQHPRTKLLIRG